VGFRVIGEGSPEFPTTTSSPFFSMKPYHHFFIGGVGGAPSSPMLGCSFCV